MLIIPGIVDKSFTFTIVYIELKWKLGHFRFSLCRFIVLTLIYCDISSVMNRLQHFIWSGTFYSIHDFPKYINKLGYLQ